MCQKGSSAVGEVSGDGFGAGVLVAPSMAAVAAWWPYGREEGGWWHSSSSCPSEGLWGAHQPLVVAVAWSLSSLASRWDGGSPCNKAVCWGSHGSPTSPAASWGNASKFYWTNTQIMILPGTSFAQTWKNQLFLTPQTVLWACSKKEMSFLPPTGKVGILPDISVSQIFLEFQLNYFQNWSAKRSPHYALPSKQTNNPKSYN